MNSIHTALARRGIYRTSEGSWLGGVCSGLARLFGVDVAPVRLLVVVAMILLPGSPLLLYPIAWILMPSEDARPVEGGTTTYRPVSDGPQDTIR